MAVPNIIGNFTALLQGVINSVIAGHMGDANKLAAVGIGNCTINIVILSVLIGVNAAIETLNS